MLDLFDYQRVMVVVAVLLIAVAAYGLGRSGSRPMKGVLAYDDDTQSGVKVFGRSGWSISICSSPNTDCLPCFVIENENDQAATLGFSVSATGNPYMQVKDPADGKVYHLDLVRLCKPSVTD